MNDTYAELYLGVSWLTIERLNDLVSRSAPSESDPIVKHELENLNCTLTAQLQKRPIGIEGLL